MFAGNQNASFPPLEVAAQLRRTEICLYMLKLTSDEELALPLRTPRVTPLCV